MSVEEASNVDFVLDNNLLHYDGDNITLTWNPNDIINPDLVSPILYSVDVEVYWYDIHNNTWNFIKALANGLNNSGLATNLSNSLTDLDSIEDYIVPIVFRIVPIAEDTSMIPDYLLPFFQNDEFGIWSSIAFKVTRNRQEEHVPGLCQDWISRENSGTLTASIPCPCSVRQARRVNSGLFELRSRRHASLRSFFNPGARNCFVSILLGYDS